MPKYMIDWVQSRTGWVEVEAETRSEAINRFEGMDITAEISDGELDFDYDVYKLPETTQISAVNGL